MPAQPAKKNGNGKKEIYCSSCGKPIAMGGLYYWDKAWPRGEGDLYGSVICASKGSPKCQEVAERLLKTPVEPESRTNIPVVVIRNKQQLEELAEKGELNQDIEVYMKKGDIAARPRKKAA